MTVHSPGCRNRLNPYFNISLVSRIRIKPFFFVGYKGGGIYWLAIHCNQANRSFDIKPDHKPAGSSGPPRGLGKPYKLAWPSATMRKHHVHIGIDA
jgi:hypothetical protein